MSKKFIYGIAKVLYEEFVVGYIEKNSWDWGGTAPESVNIEAEQVPGGPVITLITKNGSIAPKFNIIQLDYENMQKVLGGTLIGESGNYTGWEAPSELVEIRGKVTIVFVSGQTMTIPNALLMSNLGGKLTLTEVSKLECQLQVNMPEDGSKPYDIKNTLPRG